MPPAAKKSKYGNIFKSYILTLPIPQGHEMSLKCEQPLYELTVQVWLLYDHPNFRYCTSFVSEMELRTNRQTEGWTDDPNTRYPRWTYQARGITKTRHWERQYDRSTKQIPKLNTKVNLNVDKFNGQTDKIDPKARIALKSSQKFINVIKISRWLTYVVF